MLRPPAQGRIRMRHRMVTTRRAILVSSFITVLAIAWAPAAGATPLAPFIDLQEQGLTAVQDGVGLRGLASGPASLNVTVGGPVRFALLYWNGRDRPAPTSGGVCVIPSQPYRDQVLVFNGNA